MGGGFTYADNFASTNPHYTSRRWRLIHSSTVGVVAAGLGSRNRRTASIFVRLFDWYRIYHCIDINEFVIYIPDCARGPTRYLGKYVDLDIHIHHGQPAQCNPDCSILACQIQIGIVKPGLISDHQVVHPEF